MELPNRAVILIFLSISQCLASTVIVVEDAKVCFRKALSGKRVTHYVVKTLSCETLDDCRQECAMQSNFVCEGFNYRFSRGKGICELLDRPLSVMDTRRCVAYDPDTDYYERDRNSDSGCRGRRPGGSYPPSGGSGQSYLPYGGGSGGYYDNRRGDNRRNGYYYGGSGDYYDAYGGSGGNNAYYQNDYYSGSKACKGCQEKDYGYDYRKPFPSTNWYDDRRPASGGGSLYDDRRPTSGGGSLYDDRRPPSGGGSLYDDRRAPSGGGSLYGDRYRPYSGDSQKHGDFPYHQSHHHQYKNSHNFLYDYHYTNRDDYDRRHYLPRHQPAPYLPKRRHPSYDYRSYEPYLPQDSKYGRWPYYDNSRYYNERDRDRSYWGLNKKGYTWGSYGRPTTNDDYNYRKNNYYDSNRSTNYYLPSKVEDSKNWGVYGGSYGTGGQSYLNKNQEQFNYWGLDKPTNSAYSNNKYYSYGVLPPYEKPAGGSITYLPVNTYDRPRSIFHQTPERIPNYSQSSFDRHDQHFSFTKRPVGYNFIQEECSLRTVAGFKLRRPIIKKVLSVPNIYECEAFCFAEKQFRCASYAYRYTSSSSLPPENCYLSIKDFKQLDNYIDLEPDKDFDVYTMNNLARCEQPLINRKVESECFWRVRSSYRLDSSIVRDSLIVDSIVECQINCLKSYKFTCRAFTFRYGPRVLGGAKENCQLTDWPYYEIEPRTQLVPEPGFEMYERGSFGYGCEPDIRSKIKKAPLVKPNPNQLCYIGFGSPAKLLVPAIRKSLLVDTELECKLACSRLRDETLLQCMSFSYRTKAPKGSANCDISDILQRDLLLGVDYTDDPDSWLFAWDDLNPDCQISDESIANSNIKDTTKEDYKDSRYGLGKELGGFRPYDTWRVYSVNGFPCRRGTSCKQNKEAGFWYCEIEGRDNLWDYCCQPDHYCGYSQDFPYRWCYVGPERTQWRKCSDKYYPYLNSLSDRSSYKDKRQPYLPNNLYLNDYSPAEGTNSVTELRPPYRLGARPDRPPAPPQALPLQPSLNQYEEQFENEFLEPPKPGGFDQSRHWPVSYLHKEMPYNANSSQFEHKDEKSDLTPKFAAIQNLIEIIKSNDLKDVKYQISNDTSRSDDALFVKIPLPSNFTQETGTEKTDKLDSEFSVLVPEVIKNRGNLRSSTTANVTVFTSKSESTRDIPNNHRERSLPVYRRSYVERTNVTSHGRSSRIYSDKSQ